MVSEVGSSLDSSNNQAALEEQRRKQQEQSHAQMAEESRQSDSSQSNENSNKSQETTKQRASPRANPDQSLTFKLPGANIRQSNGSLDSTANDKKQNSNLSWSQLSSVTQTDNSSSLSKEDLLSHAETEHERLTDSIETSSSGDVNTLVNHIATRKDTAAFAAAHVKAGVDSERQQTNLESDHRNQSAYEQIIGHAKNLIQSGNENQARELLRQVKEQPHSLLALAEQSRAESLSPQHLRLNIESSLRLGSTEKPEEMQATQYSQMSREGQQNHTLELMSALTSQLDESSQSFIANEEAIASLANPEQRDSQRSTLNPFGLNLGQDQNLFGIKVSSDMQASFDMQAGVSDEARSMLQRLGINPSQGQIDNEISNREQYREALIKDRENLLSAHGDMIKLAQAGRADQIHLLFDGKGNPLSRETISDRASYNSGLSNEVESQYRDLNEFLHRDVNFEAGVSNLSDSLLGLSHEEQVVRARDLITEQLQSSRETLDLIRSTDYGIGKTILGKDTPALERLAAVDQGIIGNMTRETLSRRANTLFDLHDQLTDSLNSKDFELGQKAIEDFQAKVESGSYVYGRNKHTERELVNRDLARTPEETQQIEERIAALESEFEKTKESQLELVRGNQSDISSDLDEIKSFTGFKPLGLFDSRTWRVISGEDDVLFDRKDSTLNHSGEILDNLLDQQSDIKTAREQMYNSNQLERYEKGLESILGKTHEGYQSVGQQTQRDLSQISADLRGIDNFYGKTEATLEFTRNAAIITAATLATGGTATRLVASGWGLTGAGIAGFGVGTATGTKIGLISNTAEGVSRYGNGFKNPFANHANKTLQDFKTSASTSAAVASGQSLTRGLAETYKWSRLSSAIAGGSSAGFVSTNVNYGLTAAEQQINTGEIDIDGRKYLKDLLWNTAGGGIGGAIGGKFGQWQDATGSAFNRFLIIGAEETASVASDLALTVARDGKLTPEGLAQSFQSVLVGRMSAHYANQGSGRTHLEQTSFAIWNREAVKKAKELSHKINYSENDVTPQRVSELISAGSDPQLRSTILNRASQFTNLDSFNQLSDLKSVLGKKSIILTEGKGSLADVLNYARDKTIDSMGQSLRLSETLPFIVTVDSLAKISHTELRERYPNLVTAALVLDSQTLKQINDNPEIAKNLIELRKNGIDIKLVNPVGWSNGFSPYSNTETLGASLSRLEKRVSGLMAENSGISIEEAIDTALNENVSRALDGTGLENSVVDIKNPNKARYVTDRFSNKEQIDPRKLQAYIKKASGGDTRKRKALEDLFEHGFERVTLADITKLAQEQNESITALAIEKGIDPKDIQYLVPQQKYGKPKSYHVATNVYMEANNINPGQIITDFSQARNSNSMIVILDDNSLSGDSQLMNYVMLRSKGFLGEIVFAPTISTRQAEKLLIERNFSYGDILRIILQSTDSYRTDALDYDNIDQLIMNKDYDQLIMNKDYRLHHISAKIHVSYQESDAFQRLDIETQQFVKDFLLNGMNLGHNGGQTGLVFPFMSPDNNLRIFSESGLLEDMTFNKSGVKKNVNP